MAETEQRILEIVVDNSTAIKRIAELNQALDQQKEAEKELRQELSKEGADRKKLYEEIAKNKEVQKQYSSEVRALSKEIQNNINKVEEQEGSLKSLRAELSNATKEFDSLSRAEREGAKGQEMMNKINNLTNEIKDAEEKTQRYYRNVGNYTESFKSVFENMGGAVGATIDPIKNVTAGLKLMSQTPVIAILGLLATILNKVIESLKSSEENVQAMRAALGIFGAAGTAVNKIMQLLGEQLVKVVEWMGKMADRLGLVTEKMKLEQQLTKDQIALEIQEGDNIRANADSQLKISELRAKAAEKDKYSASERLKFLQEAMEAEEEMAKREKDFAAEQYRILEERSKLAQNSEEENDELDKAYAKMRETETAYYEKQRSLTKEMIRVKKEMASEDKAYVEQQKKYYDDLANLAKSAVADLIEGFEEEYDKSVEMKQKEIEMRLALAREGSREQYALMREQLEAKLEADLVSLESEGGTAEQMKLLREKYYQDIKAIDQQERQGEIDEMLLHYQNLVNVEAEGSRARLEAELELQRQRLEALHQQEDESNEAFYARQIEAQNNYNAAKKALNDYEVQMEEQKTQAIASITGSLSQMLEAIAGDNKQLAVASKVLALAQIAIETGLAVARGISGAMAVPFPTNLGAIATTLAAITAGITSAVSTVNSAKFAKGGYVTGAGTSTSDSIPARLSNGESVMNARTTSMFAPALSAMNQAGGGVAFPGAAGSQEGMMFFAKAVAAGMRAADIRVAVDEVTRVNNRVASINDIGSV